MSRIIAVEIQVPERATHYEGDLFGADLTWWMQDGIYWHWRSRDGLCWSEEPIMERPATLHDIPLAIVPMRPEPGISQMLALKNMARGMKFWDRGKKLQLTQWRRTDDDKVPFVTEMEEAAGVYMTVIDLAMDTALIVTTDGKVKNHPCFIGEEKLDHDWRVKSDGDDSGASWTYKECERCGQMTEADERDYHDDPEAP